MITKNPVYDRTHHNTGKKEIVRGQSNDSHCYCTTIATDTQGGILK